MGRQMEIRYTRHAEDKLTEETYYVSLSIQKPLIEETILYPDYVEVLKDERIRAVRAISDRRSLDVIYRDLGEYFLVITFSPAKRGRYER